MSQALAKAESAAIAAKIPSDVVRRVALDGNLAPLTEEERWAYYQEYCRYLGLDPITKPFDILEQEVGKDNAKRKIVTLYPNAKCAAQLTRLHNLTFSEPKVEMIDAMSLCIVRVEVRTPSGASRWGDSAFVYDKSKAWSLPNDYKKTVTQAHRRAVLGICGVAGPDESELDDVPNAKAIAFELPKDAQILIEAKVEGNLADESYLAQIRALAAETATDESKILAHYKVKTLEELTAEQAEDAVRTLEKKRTPMIAKPKTEAEMVMDAQAPPKPNGLEQWLCTKESGSIQVALDLIAAWETAIRVIGTTDDDMKEQMKASYGVGSRKNLSWGQARQFIGELQEMTAKARKAAA